MAARKTADKSETRFARVRQILDDAANGATADYGLGPTPFWHVDLDHLLKLSIFGVRLIAPPMQSPCCAQDGVAYCRSAASGLIKGLRGEAPFDGSRLPRLPWGKGARAVAEDDIRFIADWIDDGCPPDDRLSVVAADTEESDFIGRIKVGDIAEFGVAADGRRGYRQGELRQRPNLDCMDLREIERYRAAFRWLYSLDRYPADRRSYNNQALVHQNHCQHGFERFLPWHRAYLYEFEQNLQDFDPDLSLPYWDWTMPYYWNGGSPATGPRIPDAFKAYLTPSAVNGMMGVLQPPLATQREAFEKLAEDRTVFTTQHEFFCYVINKIGYTNFSPDPKSPQRRAMLDALVDSNALWYPLRYPAEYTNNDGTPGTIEGVIHYHYPSPNDMAQIEGLNNFRDFGGGPEYNAAFGFLDQNPHNTMHIWTGGMNPDYGATAYACGRPATAAGDPPAPRLAARRNTMVQAAGRAFHTREDMFAQPQFGDMFSNLTASFDPIFWPIHVNIDRIWSEWQRRNPNGLPADLDSVLSPWSYTIRDTLNTEVFGYEYVRGAFFMPVGLEAPVGRFVSKPIPVGGKLKDFTKAEVRLHWVPQLDRSCFIRVFLNLPGADASTGITDNPHYAGYMAVFGHGGCYGGPGHCDLPPARARSFDVRPRNHNTPRNHRVDVTAAAKELLKTADSLQITLLVIGVDYREDPDLLKLEGVSLNFLD
jgi:tyrosinase